MYMGAEHLSFKRRFFENEAHLWRRMLLGETMNGMCSSRSSTTQPFSTAPALLRSYPIKRGTVQPNDCHRQEEEPEPEAMEGKKKARVMAAAVCVLVILLSAQRLPVGVGDASSAFCQCYLGCFDPGCSGEGCQSCHDFCCSIACPYPGDGDFDMVCGGSGGQQASACGTEFTGRDLCDTVDKANYWSRRHIKAKAKHA